MAEEAIKLFDENRSYRPDEVAVKLALSEKTIRRYINDIEDPLPAFKFKSALRVHGKALNEWLEGKKVTAYR